jgi:hypothetical protein
MRAIGTVVLVTAIGCGTAPPSEESTRPHAGTSSEATRPSDERSGPKLERLTRPATFDPADPKKAFHWLINQTAFMEEDLYFARPSPWRTRIEPVEVADRL